MRQSVEATPVRTIPVIGALLIGALLSVFLSSAASAAETINYQYDTLGRLITTTRSGGAQTSYTLDAAGNRTQVQTAGVTTPSVPPWITVPATSTGSYSISWGASTSGVVTAYELYESTSAGFSTQSLASSGTGTSLPVSGKPSGTYYYRVRACNAGACSGYLAGSNGIVVTVAAGPTITLDNVSAWGGTPLGTSNFTYGLASNGQILISSNGNVNVSPPAHSLWITPASGMNLYQAKATSACANKTGTYSTWQALGTGSTPTWGVNLTPNKLSQCTISVQISALANPSVILGTATIDLDISTQP
jgi:YD repeat-containing protein